MSNPISFPLALLRFWAGRTLPLWTGAALIIFLMQIAVCAIVHDNDNVRTMLKFLVLLPSIVKTALGGDMLRMGNAPGLIAIGYQHPLVLFLYLLVAVGVPTRLLTNEVHRGTMELILSRPTTKTQVYLVAAFLTLTSLFALVLVMFLGTVVATHLYDFGEPIPLPLFFRIAVNGGLVAGAAGAIALAAAGTLAGRRAAVGVTVAILVIQYFAWVVAQWWPRAAFLKPASLFFYANGARLARGWPLSDLGVLAGIIVAATLVGGICWHRRDLPL